MNDRASDLTADRWMTFAGVLFLIGATFNAVYGIAALANDDYFASDELLFGDLAMWGALYLAVAAIEAVVGLLIINRKAFGVWLGIVLVVIHATIAPDRACAMSRVSAMKSLISSSMATLAYASRW